MLIWKKKKFNVKVKYKKFFYSIKSKNEENKN